MEKALHKRRKPKTKVTSEYNNSYNNSVFQKHCGPRCSLWELKEDKSPHFGWINAKSIRQRIQECNQLKQDEDDVSYKVFGERGMKKEPQKKGPRAHECKVITIPTCTNANKLIAPAADKPRTIRCLLERRNKPPIKVIAEVLPQDSEELKNSRITTYNDFKKTLSGDYGTTFCITRKGYRKAPNNIEKKTQEDLHVRIDDLWDIPSALRKSKNDNPAEIRGKQPCKSIQTTYHSLQQDTAECDTSPADQECTGRSPRTEASYDCTTTSAAARDSKSQGKPCRPRIRCQQLYPPPELPGFEETVIDNFGYGGTTELRQQPCKNKERYPRLNLQSPPPGPPNNKYVVKRSMRCSSPKEYPVREANQYYNPNVGLEPCNIPPNFNTDASCCLSKPFKSRPNLKVYLYETDPHYECGDHCGIIGLPEDFKPLSGRATARKADSPRIPDKPQSSNYSKPILGGFTDFSCPGRAGKKFRNQCGKLPLSTCLKECWQGPPNIFSALLMWIPTAVLDLLRLLFMMLVFTLALYSLLLFVQLSQWARMAAILGIVLGLFILIIQPNDLFIYSLMK